MRFWLAAEPVSPPDERKAHSLIDNYSCLRRCHTQTGNHHLAPHSVTIAVAWGWGQPQSILPPESAFPQRGVKLPGVAFHSIPSIDSVLQPSEESCLVQPRVADAGYDAVVAIVGGDVVLRVGLPTYCPAKPLQGVDPRGDLALGRVGPLVKLLRQHLHQAEDGKEEDRRMMGDAPIEGVPRPDRIQQPLEEAHRGNPKGETQLADIVSKPALRDRPGGAVMSLEGGNDPTHDRCPAVPVVVHAPMEDP